MTASNKFKDQKDVKSCKSSIKGTLKVGFQLLLLSNLSQATKTTKGKWKDFFFLSSAFQSPFGASDS